MYSSDSSPIFIDAYFFLGMHDSNPERRTQSLGFFTQDHPPILCMSLEQVGLCDEIIWRHSRQEQDAYYPFMDNLHSMLPIRRISYCRADLARTLRDQRLRHLPLTQACTVSQVINHRGKLYTHDPLLLDDAAVQPWIAPAPQQPPQGFDAPLDALYQHSLSLILTLQEGRYV